MTRSLIVVGLILTGMLGTAQAQAGRSPIYPFDVRVGGQLARVDSEYAVFARLPSPVRSTAEVAVDTFPGTLIINAFPSNDSGDAVDTSQSAVVLAQDATRARLDQTMNGQRLSSGSYMLNIVAGGQTSRVLIEVR